MLFQLRTKGESLDAAVVLSALVSLALLLAPHAWSFDEALSVAFSRLGRRDCALVACLTLTIGLSTAWFVRRGRPVWAIAAAALVPALVAVPLTVPWPKAHFYTATFIMLVLFRANHGLMRRPLRLRDLPILMLEPAAIMFGAGNTSEGKFILIVAATVAVAAVVVEAREGKRWTGLKTPIVLIGACLGLCAPGLIDAVRLDAISLLSAAGIAYCGFYRGALHIRQLPCSILTLAGAAMCGATHYGYGERLIVSSSLATMIMIVWSQARLAERFKSRLTELTRAETSPVSQRATVRVSMDVVDTREESNA